jgi:hypothetical protein
LGTCAEVKQGASYHDRDHYCSRSRCAWFVGGCTATVDFVSAMETSGEYTHKLKTKSEEAIVPTRTREICKIGWDGGDGCHPCALSKRGIVLSFEAFTECRRVA